MALDPYRREIPPATGVTPDWRGMITDFSASIGAIIPVANQTDQAQLVADIQGGGYTIDTGHPLFTFRADGAMGEQFEYTTDGTTWETLPSACTIQAGSWSIDKNTAAADFITSQEFPVPFLSTPKAVVATISGPITALTSAAIVRIDSLNPTACRVTLDGMPSSTGTITVSWIAIA